MGFNQLQLQPVHGAIGYEFEVQYPCLDVCRRFAGAFLILVSLK